MVADERVQKEIVDVYRRGRVEIYDYRRYPGAYSFLELQKWAAGRPEAQVIMVANFHLALQDEESLKRLNFSRDMLESLGKNFIFLVTPYGDDRLAAGAYDFYSFVKLRVIFQKYGCEQENKSPLVQDEPLRESTWNTEDAREGLSVAYDLTEQAKEEYDKARYYESEKLLLKALGIKKALLGPEHLEIAEITCELAVIYCSLGKYRKAEELLEKSLQIRKKILGEEHPDIAAGYSDLAVVYVKEGRYKDAEELYERSLRISEKVLGEEHPDTAISYNNLAGVYESQGKYQKAEELYERSLRIREKVLGEEHPDTAISYNNLAGVYESQGKYQKAEELYERSLRIREKVLGEEHPDTAVSYYNLALLYADRGEYKKALGYCFKAFRIYELRFGAGHPHTQDIFSNLQIIYSKWDSEGSFIHWLEEKMKQK